MQTYGESSARLRLRCQHLDHYGTIETLTVYQSLGNWLRECFLVAESILCRTPCSSGKPSSAYNKREKINSLLTSNTNTRQKKKQKQRIIWDDEILRKPSSCADTHIFWSAPTLKFPTSSTVLTNHLWLHAEWIPPPPPDPRALLHSGSQVSAIYSAEQGAACFNSCPVVKQATASHCSLTQLEGN